MSHQSALRYAFVLLFYSFGVGILGCPFHQPPRDQSGLALSVRPGGGFWIGGEDGTDFNSRILLLGVNQGLAETSRARITSREPRFSCRVVDNYPLREGARTVRVLGNGNIVVGAEASSTYPPNRYTTLTEFHPDGRVIATAIVRELAADIIRFTPPGSFLLVEDAAAATTQLTGNVTWMYENPGAHFTDGLAIGEDVFLLSRVRAEDGVHTEIHQVSGQLALVLEIEPQDRQDLALYKFLSIDDDHFAAVGNRGPDVEAGLCFVIFDHSGRVLHLTEFPGLIPSGVSQITAVPSGGYAITNTIQDAAQRSQVVLIKVDEDGAEQWRQVYESDTQDEAAAVLAMPDVFAITGSTRATAQDDSDVLLLLTDTEGELLQRRVYGD